MLKRWKILLPAILAAFMLCIFLPGKENETQLSGSGEDASAKEMIRLMLPEEESALSAAGEAVTATAEGELCDLLLPDYEAPEINDSPKSYSVSGEHNILIYHTHNTEAYTPTEDSQYTPSGSYRTYDESNNVVAVGDVLAEELTKYGFNVIHDKTDHEPPKLSTAYDRSVVTMEKYAREYPDIDIFIDLHRDACDAYSSDDYLTIDGKQCARMMFVVGKGEAFEIKPDFEKNYAFANALSETLNGYSEGLAKKICVKKGRYNQHIGNLSCLIEIGQNKNTLNQAKNSARLFAKAMSQTVKVDNTQ